MNEGISPGPPARAGASDRPAHRLAGHRARSARRGRAGPSRRSWSPTRELERTAVAASYPAAASAARVGPVASAVERVEGERVGRDRGRALDRRRAPLGRRLLDRPRRRRRQRRADPSPDPDRGHDRAAGRARGGLAGRPCALPAAAPARGGRREGRRRRLLEPDPGRLERRGRSARDHLQRDAEAPRAPRQRPQGVHRQRLSRAAHADLLALGLRRAARGRRPRPRVAGRVRAHDARAGRPAHEAHRRPARPLEARRRRDRDSPRVGAPRRRRHAGSRASSGRSPSATAR